jgi:hypothetical protein
VRELLTNAGRVGLAHNGATAALTDMNDEQGSDASREEPGPVSMPWAAVASVMLVANSIFAGLGSLYVTTNSVAVVVVAAILLSVLTVVIVWARTRPNR